MTQWRALLLLLCLFLPIVGCSSAPDPADRFAAFADALQRKDASGAAAQTTDPAAAEPAIKSMFDGMGDAASVKVGAEPEDGDESGATLK